MIRIFSIVFVLGLLSLVQQPLAQQYTDAYIIDQDGNRYAGTIFNSMRNDLFQRIIFRNAGNPNAAEQLTPVDVQKYGFIKGDTYVSYILTGDLIPGIKAGAIFLREVIPPEGELGLYLFKNLDGDNFYFLKEKGKEFQYLPKDSYKNTLSQYAEGCESYLRERPVSKTEYNTQHMAGFVNRYNSCKDPEYTFISSYKSEGVFYTGMRVGSGLGIIQDPYDSRDADYSITFYGEYTLSEMSSLQFEAGFLRRTTSTSNFQRGDVAIGDSLYENRSIEASSNLTLNYGQINVFYKRQVRNLGYILGGAGFGFNIANSKVEGTAEVVTPPSGSSAESSDLKVTDEFDLVGIMPNLTFGIGKELTAGSLRFSLESRVNFSVITQDKPRYIYLTNEENVTYYLLDGYEYQPLFLDFYLNIPF